MLAEAGTQESLASPSPKLHFFMARTVHYVLRVGDKSRIERFVGIAFLPELFGELFAGHDCLLRLCFHMCWDRDVLSAGYAYAELCEPLFEVQFLGLGGQD